MRFNKYYKGLTTIPNKNDTRESLRNVRVTNEFSEATDGFILLRIANQRGQVENIPSIIEDPAMIGDEFVIDAQDLARVIKQIPNNTYNRNLGTCYAWTGAESTRDVRMIIATAKPESGVMVDRIDLNTFDGDYPDTDKVVKRQRGLKTVASILVDPAQLERIARALKESGLHTVTLEILEGEFEPVKFTGENEASQKIEAYLMPMRD